MERIKALIHKLHEQSEQHADVTAMLVTVQMLEAELAQMATSSSRQMGTAKVAVVLPGVNKAFYQQAEPVRASVREADVQHHSPPVLEFSRNNSEKNALPAHAKKQEQSGWLFDPVQEIPTLAHQTEFKEMNDVFGQYPSLNDKLKTEKKELATVLTEGPVKDLKKAIGINDRFVFVSELFRGDEAMYERSLKTINNFRIYPEAEYWIERELKVKLGWDENKHAVKHFCQLVKRRFL
ncbi:MAG: hypothetical protein WKF97_00500 [Chitinophagaceae bacterium]